MWVSPTDITTAMLDPCFIYDHILWEYQHTQPSKVRAAEPLSVVVEVNVAICCCFWMQIWISNRRAVLWGSCRLAGRAGQLVIRRSLFQIPSPGWAEVHVEVSLSKIMNPDVRLTHGMAASPVSEGPCDELVTCPGCTLPSPRDSWDWLQYEFIWMLMVRWSAV